jgi:hypothetical protein
MSKKRLDSLRAEIKRLESKKRNEQERLKLEKRLAELKNPKKNQSSLEERRIKIKRKIEGYFPGLGNL